MHNRVTLLILIFTSFSLYAPVRGAEPSEKLAPHLQRPFVNPKEVEDSFKTIMLIM